MARHLIVQGILLSVAALAGCSMCQSPFDYCAPVVPQGACPNCDFGARRGSMFHPTDGTPATTPVAPTLVSPDPTKASSNASPNEAAALASTTTESATESVSDAPDATISLTSAIEDAVAGNNEDEP